ncbi:MAG: AAA family ATPase, partial [Cellulosilyticum sp.]|nr:AAA family ATPase [Cellulosilyticum sp.]
DEPENSLSPQKQLELAHFIEESARFFGCQFIISTHSPFFLAMKDAKIYDLDEMPVQVKKWTQLESVRFYYDFFKERESEF